ncbi:MAG TPA: L-histidine N(alpha)-methyltransferase [bacterium]|nr:L-histidine N(alpha)-methyltransferase [bacterium]
MSIETARRNAFLPNLFFEDRHPAPENILQEVLEGLGRRQKSLPPKLFYDREGSDLFLRITGLWEYYPTRVEKSILPKAAADLREAAGPRCELVEYGCGNSGKVNVVLGGLDRPAAYVGIEMARDHLLQCCRALAAAHPEISVTAICADFTAPLDLRRVFTGSGRKVAFFPGSSIGNFEPEDAKRFLDTVRTEMGKDGALLIGVDTKKDAAVLNAAYNDRDGVTARFNLNVLKRINRELKADFILSRFRHVAFYDEKLGRIEMHLESLKNQTVRIGEAEIGFKEGETIHTENSYKYSVSDFHALAAASGWSHEGLWKDEKDLFSLHYLVNRKGSSLRQVSNLRRNSERSRALTLIKP